MANVLTETGQQWVVNNLSNSGTYNGSYGGFVGWGSNPGNATLTETATALMAEEESTATPGQRATATSVSTVGSGAAAKWQNITTCTAQSNALSIKEAGVFDTNGAGVFSGNLFIVSTNTFTPVTLNIGETIQFTFTLDPAGC